MTRPKDKFWDYAEHMDKRFRCNFCKRDFSGGVPRIKSHLSGIKGRDIDVCTKVPSDVQLAAAAAIKGVNKRPKTEDSSNSDENYSGIYQRNDGSTSSTSGSMLDYLLAKFLLLDNVDCGVVDSPHFVAFLNAVAAYGIAYNLPSYSVLKTAVIPNLLREGEAQVSSVKESWGESGCTLISDIWCDEKQNMAYVNILASSWKGVVLVNTFEIPKKKLTSNFMDVILKFSIQNIGPNNVVQYIDGAHSVVPAGSLLVNEYPHINVTRCVAAEIQSLFEEVCGVIEWMRVSFDEAKYLATCVYGHDNFLSLMRKYDNGRELRHPNKGEFTSNYDMMLSIIEARNELLQLVQSHEWLSYDYDRHELGKEITDMIHSSEFWNRLQETVMALEPLRLVLHLLDRYGSSSGNFYVAMETATEKMKRIYNADPLKYQRLWEIFNLRKNELVSPIHAAAAFLNPAYMCADLFRDKAQVMDVMNFVVSSNLVADDDKKAFVEQMMRYYNKEPEIFSYIAKTLLETSHPCNWWDYCGHKLPVLRKYAIQILSRPCSSSVYKESLSASASAQIKQQQRFASKPCGQLPLRMNMSLAAKLGARNICDKPIDLSELGKMKLIDQNFSNDFLKLQPSQRTGDSTDQYSSHKELRLEFVTTVSPFQVTGQEVKSEDGSPVHVFLVDPATGDVVQDDQLSTSKLTVSALEGDFDEDDRNEWTLEDFEENEMVTDVPLMTGDLQVFLKKGMGTLGSFVFNFDSTIAKSKKFKLGVKSVTGDGERIIRAGVSNAFVVENNAVGRHHDDAANQTHLPEDSPSASHMYEHAPLRSPPQNTYQQESPYDDTVFDEQFYDSIWNVAGVGYKDKQKHDVKVRQAAMRWLKLRTILQWAILRRILRQRRALRKAVWFEAQKRLDEWSRGANEDWMFIHGQEAGQHDRSHISKKYAAYRTTPTKEERHDMRNPHYKSRLETDEEEDDWIILGDSYRKIEPELSKPTSSSIGDSRGILRRPDSRSGHSLTLFPTLSTEHGTPDATDDEEEFKAFQESVTMKFTDSAIRNADHPNTSICNSGNTLTLFPSLSGDFVMVNESERLRSVKLDEPNVMSKVVSSEEHIHESSPPSSMMDWEMISWRSPRQVLDDGLTTSKFENDEHHKVAERNEQQLGNKLEPSAVWTKLRSSPLHWVSMLTPKRKHTAGEDGVDAPDGDPPERLPGSSSLTNLRSSHIFSPGLAGIGWDRHWKELKKPFGSRSIFSNLPKWGCSQFTLRDLQVATNAFSRENLIGEGGYGVVYRGHLTNGMPVAVKKLRMDRNNFRLAEEDFRAVVETIGGVRHENLVQLLGFCTEGTDRLMVYEYVGNRNLRQWLHEPSQPFGHLTWQARTKICCGVAKALFYLHEEIKPGVIYRDIKCSNILIDDSFNAKLSDFGLARLLDAGESRITTQAIGTPGYLDTEYATSGVSNEKTDVYSFGVLLLEVITGRSPLGRHRTHEASCFEWADMMLRSRHPEEMLDPNIEARPSARDVTQALQIASRCLDRDANRRPKMSQVVQMLDSLECPDPPQDGRHRHWSSQTRETGTEPRNENSQPDTLNKLRSQGESVI